MKRVSPSVADFRLGIDLGGTKTEGVVLRLRGSHEAVGPKRAGPDESDKRERSDVEFEIVARKRVATLRDEGYEHVVANTAQLISDLAREAKLGDDVPIGVGMPGGTTLRRDDRQLSSEPLVKNSNTTCLNGRPFHGDLMRAVGRPIAFANDANCFALAEATVGAARGAALAFGVILGTGVGGGVVIRGDRGPRIWEGVQGIGGEWGHIWLDADAGPACYCGRRGCIEQYLSGPAIEAAYFRRSSIARTLPEIVHMRSADAHADAALTALAGFFGRALAMVINVLDPEVIVLGGGVSNLDLLYTEGIAQVSKWVFNDELKTRIVRHSLGDSAGVLGAALLSPAIP